jgi:hypothetical protein
MAFFRHPRTAARYAAVANRCTDLMRMTVEIVAISKRRQQDYDGGLVGAGAGRVTLRSPLVRVCTPRLTQTPPIRRGEK